MWVGLGLRAGNAGALLAGPASGCSLLEVHSENYFDAGGQAASTLQAASERHALSLHGVGLSLGSAADLAEAHLAALAALVDRVQPALVSEHLCWNAAPDGRHYADLLPLPRNRTTVDLLVARIQRVQERLRRPLLVEHLAAYAGCREDVLEEPDWLNQIACRSGCQLLVDLHNLMTTAHNLDFDPLAWLDAIAPRHVGQYHLAGGQWREWEGGRLRLDSHDAAPDDTVWALFRHALGRFGAHPTIVEWDTDLPSIAVQRATVAQASALLDTAARVHVCPLPRTNQVVPELHALGSAQLQWADALDGGPETHAPDGLAAPAPQRDGRFAIYRRNHQQHLVTALQALYPLLARCVGAECLRMLAWAHVRDHRMRSGNLLDYGAELPALVAARAELATWPWLADLARLEWCWHQVGRAPDSHQVLGLEALAACDEDALANLRIQPIAASQLLRSDWDLPTLWRTLTSDPDPETLPQIPRRAVQVLLARPGLSPRLTELTPGGARFWEALAGGGVLRAAVQWAREADPDFDLGFVLAQLVPAGLLQQG